MKRRALMGALLAAPSLASAQETAWPNRPVRLVTGCPPGGSVDILARILVSDVSTLETERWS